MNKIKTPIFIDIILTIIVILLAGSYPNLLIRSMPLMVDISNVPHVEKVRMEGVASWYDYSLSGEQWSRGHNTCATRDFKRYSMLVVTNLDNGKSVECYDNDYGPEIETGRLIDLSSHAFSEISSLGRGLANVSVRYK
ncbi:hypothetical protein HGB13_00010 [bacterium]|nr:hypothetical protein [bacterium]